MRILGRQYTWRVDHTRTCTRFTVPAGRGGARGATRTMRSCQEHHSGPPAMHAGDGTRIPFPSRYRQSEAYETAESVTVEIFLDVDTTGADDPGAALDSIETGPDGEVDFGSLEGRYVYIVLITIRQPWSFSLVGPADFVPAPLPVSVGMTVLNPTEMGREGCYRRELPNGITAEYYVHY